MAAKHKQSPIAGAPSRVATIYCHNILPQYTLLLCSNPNLILHLAGCNWWCSSLSSCHADDGEDKQKGGYIFNDGQAALAVRVVQRALQCRVHARDIGIMAPYTAQVNLLIEKLGAAGLKVARGVNEKDANNGGGLVGAEDCSLKNLRNIAYLCVFITDSKDLKAWLSQLYKCRIIPAVKNRVSWPQGLCCISWTCANDPLSVSQWVSRQDVGSVEKSVCATYCLVLHLIWYLVIYG